MFAEEAVCVCCVDDRSWQFMVNDKLLKIRRLAGSRFTKWVLYDRFPWDMAVCIRGTYLYLAHFCMEDYQTRSNTEQ